MSIDAAVYNYADSNGWTVENIQVSICSIRQSPYVKEIHWHGAARVNGVERTIEVVETMDLESCESEYSVYFPKSDSKTTITQRDKS